MVEIVDDPTFKATNEKAIMTVSIVDSGKLLLK